MPVDDITLLMSFYPKIYFACHTRHVNDPVKGVKLTAHQGSVLDHLDGDEPLSLQELALHLGVTPSTMSIAIERLVKLGYVKREKDKTDSRKVRLLLTTHGLKVKRSKSVLDPKLVESVLARLTKEERAAALHGLGLLASAAEMEMKSKSFEKAWAKRSDKRKNQ
ncbi:MarR family transcriptional regulator [Chryseolinea soli]|uniref:MarR family transcriptional regulator n=2 Tax=Chryseolinea soli TaxID=2321403 RepID=A0A385SSN8_9BACT|nr:MarR family transcriptional regulator [Chryseolinea soli]